VDGTVKREAGYPGDKFRFEVVPDPECVEADIQWTGGGQPATGTGRRFTTIFPNGGTYTVNARCGAAQRDFPVTVCALDEWLARAAEFYGPAVDLSRVRVTGSWAVRGPAGTGWTCNNRVRFKRPKTASDLPQESTLIHELAHVWEHQSGQAQVLRGFVEQVSRVFGGDPYDFGGPPAVKAGVRLQDFKKEGQAEIIRNYWLFLHGFPSDMLNVPFTTPGYVDDLRRLVEGAGIGTAAPAHRESAVASVDGVAAGIVNGLLALLRA
jgi:hypothetical protein